MSNRFHQRSILAALLAAVLIAPASAAPGDLTTITVALQKGEPAQVAEAISAIKRLEARVAIDNLEQTWMRQLVGLDRHLEIVELTHLLADRAPFYTADIYFLLSSRVSSLVALKQPALALSEAKRLYLAVPLRDMEGACRIVEGCLKESDGNDVRASAFRAEQAVRAVQHDPNPSILDGIKLQAERQGDTDDVAPQAELLSTKDLAKGNRLLMDDQADKAIAFFERSLPGCTTDVVRSACLAGIARSIKAKDRGLLRANEFVAVEYRNALRELD